MTTTETVTYSNNETTKNKTYSVGPEKRKIPMKVDKSDPLKKAAITAGVVLLTILLSKTRLWKSCGNFYQRQWERVLEKTGEDEFNLFFWGLIQSTFYTYWISGIIYTFMDIYNIPQFMRKYKMQPGTNEPVERNKLIKAILTVLFNQLVIGFPATYATYLVIKWRGGLPDVRIAPSLFEILFNMICLILITEIGFYYSHRSLHHKSIYKYIHKKHHEWTAPSAVMTMYCHPFEQLFGNIGNPLIGMCIIRCHVLIIWIWGVYSMVKTTNDHSGYHLPFLPSPEAHDFHHLKFNYNYGMIGLLDRIHGTDSLFIESKQGDRDFMLTNLKSARELIPDEDKRK